MFTKNLEDSPFTTAEQIRQFRLKSGMVVVVRYNLLFRMWTATLSNFNTSIKIRMGLEEEKTWSGHSRVSARQAVKAMRLAHRYQTDEKFKIVYDKLNPGESAIDIIDIFKKLSKEKRSSPVGHDLFMNSKTLSSLKTALGFNEGFLPLTLPKTQRGQPYEMLLGYRIITYDSLSNGVIFNEKGDQL